MSASKALVLCYHAVSEDWPASLAVEPEVMRAQVRAFLEDGYRATTFHELMSGPSDSARLAITFDDAYLSVYEQAFPLLEELGAPATIFVPTGHIGKNEEMAWDGIDKWANTEWHHELRGANWGQLRELGNAGWEVGSHTRSHPRLSRLDRKAINEELEASRVACESEVGRRCVSLAYPYGDFDDGVVDEARCVGFEAAATLVSRADPSGPWGDPLRVPRVAVYRGDSESRIKFKAWLLQRYPRIWNTVQRVKR